MASKFDYLNDRPIKIAAVTSAINSAAYEGMGASLRECFVPALEKAREDHGMGSREFLIIEALIAAL